MRRGFPRRARSRVVSCRSWDAVAALLERELTDAVVLDIRVVPAEAVAVFVRRFPQIPVFALSVFRPDDGELLAACRRAGLRGILLEDVDDAVAGELIAARAAGRARRQALADGPRFLRLSEPLQQRAWEEVLLRVGTPTSTADVARALGVSREHLSREFAAGGAPNLKRVIDLARVACAADLLANPGYTVKSVARILHFASASHMAGSSRRVAGAAPRELAKLGPRGVLGRFVRGRTRSRV